MKDDDRIRLAEAMGWKKGRVDVNRIMDRSIAVQRWIDPQGNDRAKLPDPFTDTNDDYAVLEWMRESVFPVKGIPSPEMRKPQSSYIIGDYARAALKVLEND